MCVRCKYLHSKALHECAQCCTWVMVPVLQSSEGPVSALEKPDSSITLRNWWMPGLVGFLLWAIIQVRGRSGFSKGSWLLTPPETGGLRPWEKNGLYFLRLMSSLFTVEETAIMRQHHSNISIAEVLRTLLTGSSGIFL